jgi:hypothetical protein
VNHWTQLTLTRRGCAASRLWFSFCGFSAALTDADMFGSVPVIIDPSCQLNRAGVSGRLHRNSDSPPANAIDPSGRAGTTWFDALGLAGAVGEIAMELSSGDTYGATGTSVAFIGGTAVFLACEPFALATGPGAAIATGGCYLLGSATGIAVDNLWEASR